MGFSPIAPIKALYIIEEDTWENCFEGAALFSVGHEYHAARRTAVTINVPVKAVESFLKKDHDAERRDFESRADAIRKSAVSVPGVQAEVFVPEVANHVPHIRLTWDAAKVGITIEDAIRAEGQSQASEQAAMANLIGSLRLISTFDWSEFFESVSLVEQVLQRPAVRYDQQGESEKYEPRPLHVSYH